MVTTITVTVDDETLQGLTRLAQERDESLDETIRNSLKETAVAGTDEPRYRNGVLLVPRKPGGRMVTAEEIYDLQDDLD